MNAHAHFEELVVGHALSALEPEDELALLRHLPTCAACERDLAIHQQTLAHLAHVVDQATPPAGLWDGIRAQVEIESGSSAFPTTGATAAGGGVVDLSAARARRRPGPRARRIGAWASVAAAVAVVAGVAVGVTGMEHDRHAQTVAAQRLESAVRSVESAPGRTVPLASRDGAKVAVAVVQANSVSLIVNGLAPNDTSSSIYVLWAQSGAGQARALATFDVHKSVEVVRDLASMPTGSALPQLFVITQESGRSAPPVAHGAALATGRAA